MKFSNLEALVTFLATALMLETPDVCMGILGELSFRKKVDVLAALLRARRMSVADSTRIDAALKLVYASEEGRNRLMHCTWGVGAKSDDDVFRMKPNTRGRSGFDFGFRSVAADEITLVSAAIQKAIGALSDCAHSLQEQRLLRFNIMRK